MTRQFIKQGVDALDVIGPIRLIDGTQVCDAMVTAQSQPQSQGVLDCR